MNRLPTLGLTALIAVLVVACSSGPSASPSATVVASQPASVAPTTATTASAAATSSGSEVAIPSFELPNSAPELLALLPDKIGEIASFPGAELSMNGKDFVEQGGDQGNQEFVDFLDRLDASTDDVSVASKTYADASNPTDASAIFAFRVAGADSGKLLTEMQTAMGQDQDNVTWSSANVGGKSVQVAETDQTAGGKTYLYVVNDIVFAVIASDDKIAADALSQLP